LLPRTTLLVGVLAAACAALGACSGSDGQTPACTPNVTANGIENITNGCEQFPPCLDANGNAQPAVNCCPADAGDVAACLYAYGAGGAPGSSGGTGGSDGG
jgi:hypothetical protein